MNRKLIRNKRFIIVQIKNLLKDKFYKRFIKEDALKSSVLETYQNEDLEENEDDYIVVFDDLINGEYLYPLIISEKDGKKLIENEEYREYDDLNLKFTNRIYISEEICYKYNIWKKK
ncbi:MAG: hypothetical protein R6U96_18780 [Promethearchaeia archaeon]